MFFTPALAPFGGKKVLLVQPNIGGKIVFWGFQASNELVGAKATHIPLGLATLAALLPASWIVKIIDMNVQGLADDDIARADLVFVTGMIIHKETIATIIDKCNTLGKPVVVGGPFASITPDAPELAKATAVFSGEVEGQASFAEMLDALCRGDHSKRVYRAEGFADITQSPVPRFDLLDLDAYVDAAVQTSRGCMHSCEFCSIHEWLGPIRYKTPEQVVKELAALHALGFRKNIFVVDDDFSGRLSEAERIVDAIAVWQKKTGFKHQFITQADIGLGIGQGRVLARKMARAGFYVVFLGLESPSKKAMKGAGKNLNANNDMATVCANLLEDGLFPYAGLILGFDTDDSECFSAMIEFVKACRLPVAMVGTLFALPGTKLHMRMVRESRLIFKTSMGDSGDQSNIMPSLMTNQQLWDGYRSLMAELYAPENYFRRAAEALVRLKLVHRRKSVASEYLAAFRSVLRQGLKPGYRFWYWKFILRFLFTKKVGFAFMLAILLIHLRQYVESISTATDHQRLEG